MLIFVRSISCYCPSGKIAKTYNTLFECKSYVFFDILQFLKNFQILRKYFENLLALFSKQ